jgi:hypothetical protein
MRSRLMQIGWYSLGLVVALFMAGGQLVLAQAPPTVGAPEIDGGTLASGLGLLTAGVLILRSRWK